MMTRWMRRCGLGCGGIALLAGAVFVTQPRLRDWIYREASYQVVLDSVVGRETDPLAITEQVTQYVHMQMYPRGGAVIDTDSWTHLVRGIGWCDQKAWTIGTLLALRGIPSRLVMLLDDDGASPDSGLEIFLDGQWRYVGPLRGTLYWKPDGTLATLQDLSANPSLVLSSPTYQLLTPAARQDVLNVYKTVLPLRRPPIVWNSIGASRQANPVKHLGAQCIHWLWARAGAGWAAAFQDLYLFLLPERLPTLSSEWAGDPSSNHADDAPALRLYYCARNYHLYGRLDKAAAAYRAVMTRYPHSAWVAHSQFWLGVAHAQRREFPEAIRVLAALAESAPASAADWQGRVYDELALVYQRAGDAEHRAYYEALALNDSLAATAGRLTMHVRQVKPR